MSNKLNTTIKKIEKVFNAMKAQRVSLKTKGGAMSDDTIEQYQALTIKYAKDIHERFGIANCRKWKEEHFMSFVQDSIELWNQGELSKAYGIRQMRSAIKSFRHGTEVTDVFKKRIDCIDPEKVEETLHYNHIKRMSEATTTLSATKQEGEMILNEIKNSKSRHKEDAYHAFKISMLTGARFMDVLSLEKKNIDFENNTITFVASKGNLTSTVPLDDETMDYLKNRSEGKGENSKLIRVYREKNGKHSPMSNEVSKATLGRIISTSGSKVINGTTLISYKYRNSDGKTQYRTTVIEKKVSHHTARKIFTNERYKYYKSLPTTKLNKELEKRLEDEKIREKYNTAVKRINRNRNLDRDMHHYEKSCFLTSLDSRHFRNDILVSFYLLRTVVKADRNEARKNSE